MADSTPLCTILQRKIDLTEKALDGVDNLLRYARMSGYIDGLREALSTIREQPVVKPVFYTPPRIAAIAKEEQAKAPKSPAPRRHASVAPSAPPPPIPPAPLAVQTVLSLDTPAPSPKPLPPAPSSDTSYGVTPLGGVGGSGNGSPPLAHIIRYTHALDWLRAHGDEAKFEDFSEIWRVGRRTTDRRVRCAAMNCALMMEKKGIVEIARDPRLHNRIISIRRKVVAS